MKTNLSKTFHCEKEKNNSSYKCNHQKTFPSSSDWWVLKFQPLCYGFAALPSATLRQNTVKITGSRALRRWRQICQRHFIEREKKKNLRTNITIKKTFPSKSDGWVQSFNPCVTFRRSSFSDFASKYGKDDRFKGIEKMRERESLFTDFVSDVRRREKEEKSSQREKVGSINDSHGMLFVPENWLAGKERLTTATVSLIFCPSLTQAVKERNDINSNVNLASCQYELWCTIAFMIHSLCVSVSLSLCFSFSCVHALPLQGMSVLYLVL